MSKSTFAIFGTTEPKLAERAVAPPWRGFAERTEAPIKYETTPTIVRAVNAALHLRRPLLVTGGPGTGKSSLAREIARQLGAERLLKWPINSKSTLTEGLYRYDAVGRLRDLNLTTDPTARAAIANEEAIGQYLSLGPLGTALAPPDDPSRLRVLLIDELDKADLDLPNDLLDVLEDGDFVIPELQRFKDPTKPVPIRLDPGKAVGTTARAATVDVVDGKVKVSASAYPFILITSNREREFSPAFHRRCVHLDLPTPVGDHAVRILEAQLGALDKLPDGAGEQVRKLAAELLVAPADGRTRHSVDQILSLAWLLTRGADPADADLLGELKASVARDLLEPSG